MPCWALLACGGAAGDEGGSAVRVVALEAPHPGDADRISAWAAAIDGVRVVRTSYDEVTLEVAADRLPLSLDGIAELCPATIDRDERVIVSPRLRMEPEPPPFGFEQPFRIEVAPGCREALSGRLTWRSERGRDLSPLNNGFVVMGRTPPMPPHLTSTVAFGIVPVGADAAGEDVLHLRFEQGGAAFERTIRVRAANRASGIPSVPVGASLYIAGGPFEIREGDAPRIEQAGTLERVTFERAGRYVLAASGRELAIRVGGHRDTPLDCGRPECHASAAAHAASSPMTTALVGHLSSDGSAPTSCATPCHAVSEPGLPDGGFAHVARERRWSAPILEPEAPLSAMPRALRRLAGVGCTACHGPGAIPEESARWAILRSDVCAVCHDAPPRYGHVAAWRGSAMASADRNPRTWQAPCAGCHTTDGFLARLDVAPVRHVPDEARPIGIACAACHAPHAEHGDRLVREVAVPASLGELPASAQRICLPCHAPTEDGVRSAQAVFALGRGALDPTSGAPIVSSDGHAALRCTDCHAASASSELERGAGHAFAIDPARCVSSGCHGETPSLDVPIELAARIAMLPASAHDGADVRAATDTVSARVGYDAALVHADRAAHVHGRGYLLRVLDAIEAARP